MAAVADMGLPIAADKPVVLWKPNGFTQESLIQCPVEEVFFGGARGGGKTDAMLGDFLFHAFEFGEFAKGVFFRRTLPQLEEVISRVLRLFARFGKYHEQRKVFVFQNGATLKFRYMDGYRDAENYQGHEYTRIYIEEVTNWADPKGIDLLKGSLRSSADVPCRMRLTGNPGGVGHGWVKARYIDAAPPRRVVVCPVSGMRRVYIPSRLDDNPYLGQEYVAKLQSIGTPEIVRAWLEGDWEIADGAYLASLWRSEQCVVEPFDIPDHWVRWRSMDWGYAKPYCVLWFAKDEAGCVYVYRELYGIEVGVDGLIRPNRGSRETAEAVAEKVKAAEAGEVARRIELRDNVADPAIWANTGSEMSIEEHFRKGGVVWWRADNSPGSRKQGAQEICRRLQQGKLKFFKSCRHTIRTVSSIPVSPRDPEDVDTNAEDHAWDTVRYGLRRRKADSKKPEPPAVNPMAWQRNLLG